MHTDTVCMPSDIHVYIIYNYTYFVSFLHLFCLPKFFYTIVYNV